MIYSIVWQSGIKLITSLKACRTLTCFHLTFNLWIPAINEPRNSTQWAGRATRFLRGGCYTFFPSSDHPLHCLRPLTAPGSIKFGEPHSFTQTQVSGLIPLCEIVSLKITVGRCERSIYQKNMGWFVFWFGRGFQENTQHVFVHIFFTASGSTEINKIT